MSISVMLGIIVLAVLGAASGSGFAWLVAGEFRERVNAHLGAIVSMVCTGVLLWCLQEIGVSVSRHAATLAVLLSLPVGYWMTEN